MSAGRFAVPSDAVRKLADSGRSGALDQRNRGRLVYSHGTVLLGEKAQVTQCPFFSPYTGCSREPTTV